MKIIIITEMVELPSTCDTCDYARLANGESLPRCFIDLQLRFCPVALGDAGGIAKYLYRPSWCALEEVSGQA